MKNYYLFLVCVMSFSFLACDEHTSANDRERQAVNRQQETFLRSQPTPVFEWSLERSLMIQLYNARNARTLTYSYVIHPHTGQLIMSCESMGFPIPATVQLTNPQTIVENTRGTTTIAQAEPNGLYAPPSTNATWVMCIAPNGGVEPRYVENDVIATVRPMEMQNGQLVPVANGRASLTLSVTR